MTDRQQGLAQARAATDLAPEDNSWVRASLANAKSVLAGEPSAGREGDDDRD